MILIYSEKYSNRLNYILKEIFNNHLGLAYTITNNLSEYENSNLPKIIYNSSVTKEDLQINPHTLLFETDINSQHFKTCVYNGNTVPFANQGNTFPFDIFAAIFYLISRYEEYLPFNKNQYGQFKAKNSLAYKLDFLDTPIVDIWVEDLKNKLKNKYPEIKFKPKKAKAIFTYDIDVAFAYLGRTKLFSFVKNIQNLIQLNLKILSERKQVLDKKIADPFDTYKYIQGIKKTYNLNTVFFFLVGKRNKYNRNISPESKVLQNLILDIKKDNLVGIHPSYFANENFNLLNSEKSILEKISHKKIILSRQHYLRLTFPTTYNNLIKAKITDDYTLGFAELPGFRASTCTPFNFFDVLKNVETSLVIHPTTFMEGTFIDDMKLSLTDTFLLMKKLANEVKNVNGDFIPIWHNHSLSDVGKWKGLRNVHDNILIAFLQD